MLIESYVIGFAEVKRCIASLRPNDFVVVSENIFMLRENAIAQPVDLLADSTPKKALRRASGGAEKVIGGV